MKNPEDMNMDELVQSIKALAEDIEREINKDISKQLIECVFPRNKEKDSIVVVGEPKLTFDQVMEAFNGNV